LPTDNDVENPKRESAGEIILTKAKVSGENAEEGHNSVGISQDVYIQRPVDLE
jgi:hypothetical protein